MSNTQHTPEPWIAEGVEIFRYLNDGTKSLLGTIVGYDCTVETDEANAKHIVMCVNENYELLSLIAKTKAELMDSYSLIGQYRGQRDALLRAALKSQKELKTMINSEDFNNQDTVEQAINTLGYAIHTVKQHDHSKDQMMEALEQILKDSAELPHIHEIARKALEKGGAV